MFNIIKKIPLCNCQPVLYSGAIFNNKDYKFLDSKDNRTDVFNECLDKIRSKTTCSIYLSITNSLNCNLFYVVKKDDNNNLYLIDNHYCEIDKIELKVPREYNGIINAIAYDEKNCKIIIATKTKLFSVTLDGYFIKNEISQGAINEIGSNIKKSQPVKDLCGCCWNNNYQVNIPCITSVGVFCNKKYVAYVKGDAAFIALLTNNGDIISTFYIGDNIEINAILNVCDKMNLLITKSDSYNYLYKTDYKCCKHNNNCQCCCDCDNRDYNCQCCRDCCDCDYNQCCNNCYDWDNSCCCDNCSNNGHCCDDCDDCDYYECKNKCCSNSNIDIIESIALIETAISHILNAEGEKIQKAVEISGDLNELIKTNDSVTRVIYNVTMLEQLLLDKLKLVTDEDKKNNHCDDISPCD